MICLKCGRELQDNAVKCKGCGQAIRRRGEKQRTSVKIPYKQMLLRETRLFGWPVWQTMTFAASAIILLAAVGITLPSLLTYIPEPLPTPEVSESDFVDDVPASAQKTGLLLVLDEIDGTEVVVDSAYDDGSYYSEISADGGDIIIKLQRLPALDGTLMGQMQFLYPDLAGEPLPSAGQAFGDYSGSMWHLDAEDGTGGRIVDILYIPTGNYDQIMQIEASPSVYENSGERINQLFSAVALANFEPDAADSE